MPTAALQRRHIEVTIRGMSCAKNLLLILSSLVTVVLLSVTSLAQQGTLTDDTSYPKSGGPGGGPPGGPGGGQTTQSELTLKVQGPGAATGAATAFIKFKLTGGTPVNVGDLPSGTPGGHVAKATLKLFVSGVGTAGSFDLYRVTSPWTEGGAATPSYDAAAPVLTGVQVSAAGSYVTLDITTLVRQWLDYDPNNPAAGGYPNHGLAFVASAAAPTTSVEFDSKEATQTSHHAQLGVVLNHAQTADHATAADNAAAVTDGVYVTGSYADPPWITSLAGGKISGLVGEAAHATSADNAVTANVANSLSAGAVVPGSQVSGDIAGRASSITGNVTGGQVSGPVAEASHAASADNAANALNATNAVIATTADAARGVVSAAGDADISSPAAGQLYFNTTLKVFRQYDGTVWKSVDAGLAAQLSSAGTLNAPANPVDWTQLKNVPASAANGYTAGGGIQIDAAGVISNAGVLTVGAAGPLSTSGGAQNPTVSLTGVVPVANGGTGLSSAGAAGRFLRSNGSVWTSAALAAADVPAGSANYIQNSAAPQAGANFNISGSGTLGGSLTADAVNAATQYNIAGQRVLSTQGGNTYVGVTAGGSNTTGFANSFFGNGAGSLNTTGYRNSFFGSGAGRNSTGGDNSFFGSQAGEATTTGNSNSFFGSTAGLHNTTGFYNSFFGDSAGANSTEGVSNSFFGFRSGFFNTAGSGNAFFGNHSGQANTTGGSNTFVGSGAGQFNTVESNNTFVGSLADGAPGVTNATAVGVRAQVTQSNSLVLGGIGGVNGATADTNVGIGTTAPAQRLDVVGNVRIGGAGNGLIFPDGTTQFSAASGTASDLACAGCVSEAELSYTPATAAELAAHKASGDHDGRYSALGHTHDVSQVSGAATLGANSFSGAQNVAGDLNATGALSGASANIGSTLSVGSRPTGGTLFTTNTINRFAEVGSNVGFDSFGTTPGIRLHAADPGLPNPNTWGLILGDGDGHYGSFIIRQDDMTVPGFGYARNRFIITKTGDVIVNSGRLGVGTESPSARLDVVGDARASGNVTAASFTGDGSGLTNVNAAGSLNGVVPTANGGTGLSSAGTAGSFLRSDGSSWTSAPLTASDVPAGSASYVQNSTAQQPGNFNISGDGTAGGTLSATVLNAATQFNLGGNRVLSVAGGQNVFAGVGAGQFNTAGARNAFFGAAAGSDNTTGLSNAFFGASAGKSSGAGSYNSYFGDEAGTNGSGSFNAFFGYRAGYANSAGEQNAFFGHQAGRNNTAGSGNTFVGYNAGQSNTTGSGNVYIGWFADGVPGITNATAIGTNVYATQSNTVILGNDANVGVGTSAPSQKLEVVGNVKIGGSGNGLIFPDGTTLLTAPTANPVATNLNCSGCVSEAELDFDPATQAELDAHKSSADHDARYVPRTGGTMTGALSLPSGGLNVAGSELAVTGGNVGIGTASPAAKLDVEGVARLRYLIATPQDAGLEGGEVSLQGAPGFHSWQMDNYGGTFRLHNQGVSKFEVTAAGNVGIGTGSPSQKLEVVGNVRVNGNFVATGLKSAVVTLPDNREVALYAVESPGNWFEDFGHATLNGGVAHVELDPTFAQTVNTEITYHVFLTPNGNCNGLYVARKTATGFEVREFGGGQTNVAFDYRVVARRKGYENVTSRAR